MKTSRIIVSATAAVLAAATALPAFAAEANTSAAVTVSPGVIMKVTPGAPGTHPAVSASANIQAGTVMQVNPGGPAVSSANRLQLLETALARVGTYHLLSADVQAKVKASIQAQIDALKAGGQPTGSNVSAANGTPTVSSAGGAFFVVMSKAAITAAGDHLLAVAGQLENLSAKLETRIGAAANVNAASLNATLADMKAKTADAKVQANAALSLVADLSDSDTSASADASVVVNLKKAAADIQAARADVAAAYKDASTIIMAVKGTGPAVSAAANVNAQ